MPVSPRISTVESVGADGLHLPNHPFPTRALADKLAEIALTTDLVLKIKFLFCEPLSGFGDVV